LSATVIAPVSAHLPAIIGISEIIHNFVITSICSLNFSLVQVSMPVVLVIGTVRSAIFTWR